MPVEDDELGHRSALRKLLLKAITAASSQDENKSRSGRAISMHKVGQAAAFVSKAKRRVSKSRTPSRTISCDMKSSPITKESTGNGEVAIILGEDENNDISTQTS